MNTSIARTGVVAALAVTALLAGCSSTGTATDPVSSQAPVEDTSSVQVISQTNLLLVTAQETLEARGLVVEVVDADGQPVTAEDPTQFVVVSQDPESGTVDAGSTVVLGVKAAG